MTQPQTERILDQLAKEIHTCVSQRAGRLSWLQVSAPEAQAAEIREQICGLLTRMGLDFIDVEVKAAEGAPRVLECKFDEGWS